MHSYTILASVESGALSCTPWILLFPSHRRRIIQQPNNAPKSLFVCWKLVLFCSMSRRTSKLYSIPVRSFSSNLVVNLRLPIHSPQSFTSNGDKYTVDRPFIAYDHPHTETVTVQPYSNILHKCCRSGTVTWKRWKAMRCRQSYLCKRNFKRP